MDYHVARGRGEKAGKGGGGGGGGLYAEDMEV